MSDTTASGERIVDVPRGLDQHIASYKAITLGLAQLERDTKKLKAERDLLKQKIVAALKINPDVDTAEKLILTRSTVPVLRVTIYPHTSIDPNYISEFYPEIFQKASRTRQEVRLLPT
jgi:hypothetical protein